MVSLVKRIHRWNHVDGIIKHCNCSALCNLVRNRLHIKNIFRFNIRSRGGALRIAEGGFALQVPGSGGGSLHLGVARTGRAHLGSVGTNLCHLTSAGISGPTFGSSGFLNDTRQSATRQGKKSAFSILIPPITEGAPYQQVRECAPSLRPPLNHTQQRALAWVVNC